MSYAGVLDILRFYVSLCLTCGVSSLGELSLYKILSFFVQYGDKAFIISWNVLGISELKCSVWVLFTTGFTVGVTGGFRALLCGFYG